MTTAAASWSPQPEGLAELVELFRQSLQQVWRALYRWTITEGLRRLDLDGESETDTAPDASNTLAVGCFCQWAETDSE